MVLLGMACVFIASSLVLLCGCTVVGHSRLLDCDHKEFYTENQYYNCVKARELVEVNKMLREAMDEEPHCGH